MATRLQWWWVFWSFSFFFFFCYRSFRNLFVLHYYLLSLLYGDFRITRDRLDEGMLYFFKFLNSGGSLILLKHTHTHTHIYIYIYISFIKLLCMSTPLVRCWRCNHDSIVWNYLIVTSICCCCYVFWFSHTKHAWWSIEQGMTGGWK